MKYIIALLILPVIAFAQSGFRLNDSESFNVAVVLDPNASLKEKGLNIGAEIEYVGAVYVKASVTSFAVLQDGYVDTTGSFGLSFTSGYFEKIRYYVGGRLGLIHRKATYPTAGVECGIDFMVTDDIFMGIRSTYDYRSDFEFYDWHNEMRYSGFIRLGVKI
jgi:hypothetical protein